MGFLAHSCTLHRSHGSEPLLPSIHDPLPACRWDDKESSDAIHSALSSASSSDLEERDVGADMVAAVKVLLQGLGEDVNRVGLVRTPIRVAHAFAFATKGYRQVAQDIVGGALFPEAGVEAGSGRGGGFGGIVVVRNIDLFSLCESCLLPFKVCCHVAYITSGLQVVGLSKLSRVADMFARRLQNPWRLAEEISQGLSDAIQPLGVGVVLQSWHLPVPGVHDDENSARIRCAKNMFLHSLPTFAGKGRFDDRNSDAWSEFLAILQLESILVYSSSTAECNGAATKKIWCPCRPLDEGAGGLNPFLSELACDSFTGTCVDGSGIVQSSSYLSAKSEDSASAMVAAVETILHAVGEDISKEELRLTPKSFIGWLLNFKKVIQESDDVSSELHHTEGTSIGMNGHNLWPPLNTQIAGVVTRETVHGSGFLVELDAPFCSLCEHHLLPFYGKAHVGYFTTEAEEVIFRSAVLSIVEGLSQRLQVQERLTRQIAETMRHTYNVQSIIVVLEASHICMVSRGIEKLGSSTATVAVFGRFASDASAKAEFFRKITGRSVERT